ncbi:hypothetical protein C8Q78DRAFT_1078043 [Trametes maxima]|nr:hypothetical protein C8Q78DRAFT_1078043 [Trametes maxima]
MLKPPHGNRLVSLNIQMAAAYWATLLTSLWLDTPVYSHYRRLLLHTYLHIQTSRNWKQSIMASVTDHYTASGLTLLMQTVRGQSSMTLFEPNRVRDSVSAIDAHGYQHRIEKTGITQLTGFYGCGYDIIIPIPGTRKTRSFVLWVENPVANLEVNRQAVLKGLHDIIHNPHSGKVNFTVDALVVAAQLRLPTA